MNKILNFFKNNSWWISIILSTGALCFSLFRTTPFEMDWAGIVTGALSVLVTILIGWQISTVLNFQKEKENVFKSVEFTFVDKYKKDFDDKILKFNKEKIILNYNIFKKSHIKKDSFYEEFLHAIEILKTYNDEFFDVYFYEHVIFLLHKDVMSRKLEFQTKNELSDIMYGFKYILKIIKEPAATILLEEIEKYLKKAKVLNLD